MLGQHTIRRVDLSPAAPEADKESTDAQQQPVLFYQEQAVLRSICYADQYLHVSQSVNASMRIQVQARSNTLLLRR